MDIDGAFYKDLIDNLYDGVYYVNRERVISYWNKGAERITGYKAHQVTNHACHENILNHVKADGTQLCFTQCPLAACMEDGNPREVYAYLHHTGGYRVPIRVRTSPLRDTHENIIGAVEIFSMALEEMNLRYELRKLRHTAHTDTLTGISNRKFLEGRLRAVIEEFKNQLPAVGLLFIDVDNFKHINDQYGHEAGDKVLRMIAETLRYNIRRADVVGRWGGEEFLAILYDVSSPDELRSIAENLRILVESSHLDLVDKHLKVTISGGGTLLQTGDTPESIVLRSDELMYQSKQAGRNRISIVEGN